MTAVRVIWIGVHSLAKVWMVYTSHFWGWLFSFPQELLLRPFPRGGRSFAQFINRNHFAFLVEAAMGLLMGIAFLRQGRHERLLVYLSAILLLWVALVLSRSRGGLLAVTVEVVCAASLFIYSRAKRSTPGRSTGWR
jgi:hypothetical protein